MSNSNVFRSRRFQYAHGKKAPDVSNICRSIRARGVLVPLLVRPQRRADTYESSRAAAAGSAPRQ